MRFVKTNAALSLETTSRWSPDCEPSSTTEAPGTRSPFTSRTVPLMFAGSRFEVVAFGLPDAATGVIDSVLATVFSDCGLGASGRADEGAVAVH